MEDIFRESLFCRQPGQFEKIDRLAKAFGVNYCGNMIIRDSIFEITANYAKKRELSLEILRYPFMDEELWAFTFVKKGTLFLCVNTELPVCKQIFAAAHELYHIHCYAEDTDPDTITEGSLLDSRTADDPAVSQEDMEANAFAGLLLMPDGLLDEQLRLYNINCEKISVDDVLILMELFALPYKAVVLRLAENRNITPVKVRELLKVDTSSISERIMLTGKALGYQQSSRALLYFGSLLENMKYNSENELLAESREKSDQEFIKRIRNEYCAGGRKR